MLIYEYAYRNGSKVKGFLGPHMRDGRTWFFADNGDTIAIDMNTMITSCPVTKTTKVREMTWTDMGRVIDHLPEDIKNSKALVWLPDDIEPTGDCVTIADMDPWDSTMPVGVDNEPSITLHCDRLTSIH